MRGSTASAVAATVNAFIILASPYGCDRSKFVLREKPAVGVLRVVEYTGRREEVRSGAPRAALPPRGRAGNMKSTKEENMHKSLGILVTWLLVSASCFAQG